MALFHHLMYWCRFFKTAAGEDGKGASIHDSVVGGTECASAGYPNMVSMGKVQKHLWDKLSHGLQKQVCDLMCYLCDSLKVMYPQFMTPAQKAESKQEDRPGEGVWVRLAQSKWKDEIMSLKEQIVQLQVVIQRTPHWTAAGNPRPLGNVGNVNRNQSNTRGNGNSWNCPGRCDHSGMKCFYCDTWGRVASNCPSTPLNENRGW